MATSTRRTASTQQPRRSDRLDVMGLPTTLRPVDLDTFFRPTSVAVVGASDTDRRPNSALTAKITAWAESRGATIHYVNPNRPEVAGRKSAPSLAEVGEAVDLVAILVGDPLPVVKEAVECGARFAVVFAAGFAEVGKEGQALQDELEKVIASGRLHVLGPNTNLNAFEEFRQDLPGQAIALITQSGHQGRPVFQGQEIGIRLSHWAPTGNEADLEVADFIAYFADLADTGAVACYIEGFKDGRTLQLAADHAARQKVPVVAVKVGRTAEGTAMAKAHTGHLTGSDAVISAVFRQYGMTRVDGLDQLLEVAATFARSAPPSKEALRRLRRGQGGRVCVYSISGGTGAHMADLVAASGLELPQLTEATQRQLHEWIPPYLRVSNPVDNGGPPVRDWRGPKIIEAIIEDPNVDLILCPITGALPSMADKLTADLVEAAQRTQKPLLVVWGSPTGTEDAYRKTLLQSAVPTFRTFTNAVMAAKAYFDFHRFTETYRSAFARPPRRPSASAGPARAIIEGPSGDGSRPGAVSGATLPEDRSKELLAAYGIPVPTEHVVTSARQALEAAKHVGFPLVLKVISPDIPHKSDLGLVEVGVRNEGELRRLYRELIERAAAAAPQASVEGILVAQQVPGVETVVGVAQDQLFGPVVMFGLGGVLVEVLGDVTFRVPPFTAADAAAMLGELKGAALLGGVRGQKAVDRKALVQVIMGVQRLATDLAGTVAELDINPLMASPQGAVAADALVVLS